MKRYTYMYNTLIKVSQRMRRNIVFVCGVN